MQCASIYMLYKHLMSQILEHHNNFVFCGIGYWQWSIHKEKDTEHNAHGIYLLFNPNLNCEDFRIRPLCLTYCIKFNSYQINSNDLIFIENGNRKKIERPHSGHLNRIIIQPPHRNKRSHFLFTVWPFMFRSFSMKMCTIILLNTKNDSQ